MIPSHSVFLRELFIPIWGAGVTRQKKTEDRTRELRKKARRPSGQCKDGRARIKRTSTRETLPETTRRPRGWAPSARRTRQRLPRSFVQGATGTGESERGSRKRGLAWRDAARAPGRSSRLLSHATSEALRTGSTGRRRSFSSLASSFRAS